MHWIAVGGAVRVDIACASKKISKKLPAMHGKGRGRRTWRAVATNNAKQAAVSIQRPVARRLFVELHDGCFRIRRLVHPKISIRAEGPRSIRRRAAKIDTKN